MPRAVPLRGGGAVPLVCESGYRCALLRRGTIGNGGAGLGPFGSGGAVALGSCVQEAGQICTRSDVTHTMEFGVAR